MKNAKTNSIFFPLLISISLLFLILIGFDVFPFLRGPAPYPPQWQWPYLVSNTLSKLWAPLLIGSLILGIAYFLEKQKEITPRKWWFFLGAIFILGIAFQL